MRIQSHGVSGDRKSFNGLMEGMPSTHITQINTVSWFNDFISYDDGYADAAGNWVNTPTTTTPTGSAGLIRPDVLNGVMRLDAGSVAAAGIAGFTWTGTGSAGKFVLPRDNKSIVFASRFLITAAAPAAGEAGAIFVGLASPASAAILDLGGTSAFDALNYMGFWTDFDSRDLRFRSLRAGVTEANISVGTLVENTYMTVGFRADCLDISSDTANGGIKVFMSLETSGLDGIVPTTRQEYFSGVVGDMGRVSGDVAATNNTIPNVSLTPGLAIINKDTSDEPYLDVDFMYVGQSR